MDIGFLSAVELAKKIREKEISCVELLQHYLSRVDKYNESINAIVVDLREQALEEAKRLDNMVASGEHLGPLHGVPMKTTNQSRTVARPKRQNYQFYSPHLHYAVTSQDFRSTYITYII